MNFVNIYEYFVNSNTTDISEIAHKKLTHHISTLKFQSSVNITYDRSKFTHTGSKVLK